MDWPEVDWQALERLRSAFLEGSAGQSDYWRTESDLASYDHTFAQRIGWKWDYVLNELNRRGWAPPQGSVLDWGCGSGIAGRAFADHFGLERVSRLRLWDRSPLAMRFASGRAANRFPTLAVELEGAVGLPVDTLLLSHVLTELDAAGADDLLQQVRNATAVLWIEPGTFAASRRLSQFRDALRDSFNVAAPCTHNHACPMFAQGNESHWCHHFAAPPAGVFQDGNWARFARLTGVDLRSLPLSFIVLDKRPVAAGPPLAVRVIGRPRVYKAHAQVLGCGAEGLHERRLSKRSLPAEFRAMKKGQTDPLQVWECEQNEIVRAGRM